MFNFNQHYYLDGNIRALILATERQLKVKCMYKLYLMTVKTWLQSNLPQGRLVSKS